MCCCACNIFQYSFSFFNVPALLVTPKNIMHCNCVQAPFSVLGQNIPLTVLFLRLSKYDYEIYVFSSSIITD
jgi:hypothetical protein